MIKIEKPENLKRIPKAWGEEVIIYNGEEYCGKILKFKRAGSFSMHFHGKKIESFYVNKGSFVLEYIDTENADKKSVFLEEGMVIHISNLQPHKLSSLNGGEIFEVSTQHFDNDSYRVEKGDSQK